MTVRRRPSISAPFCLWVTYTYAFASECEKKGGKNGHGGAEDAKIPMLDRDKDEHLRGRSKLFSSTQPAVSVKIYVHRPRSEVVGHEELPARPTQPLTRVQEASLALVLSPGLALDRAVPLDTTWMGCSDVLPVKDGRTEEDSGLSASDAQGVEIEDGSTADLNPIKPAKTKWAVIATSAPALEADEDVPNDIGCAEGDTGSRGGRRSRRCRRVWGTEAQWICGTYSIDVGRRLSGVIDQSGAYGCSCT
ncbi:hypothetical protein GALMADRAFT_1328633 [Galerina marginata CBS 339.88]|uniref:Uncharacterized protein n=1 Tax=Galerina marginata (strain CBS 339.88) TaxID=685588 RepID=A0A067T0P7_GALM3|nr:hypothetical protein GALMADRAFT_1328633 [Galerina marginata CBS 339.88]